MGGGLVQLIANKTDDTKFLIGNPDITFFKIVYRRHTNFAVESIEQKFLSDPIIGSKLIAIISKEADLCNAMYLEISLPHVLSGNKYIYGVGNALIKEVSIDIGGTIIDTHYNDWLNIWGELTVSNGKREGYDRLVGNNPNNTFGLASSLTSNSPYTNRLYIPLQFWFNRNPGLALPLLSLQNTQIKLNIQLASYAEITHSGTIVDTYNEFSCRLFIDYIYLDNDEKQRFTQLTHEYLIEQVQYNNDFIISSVDQGKNIKIDLQFERPVKEVIWVNHLTVPTNNELFDYSNGSNSEVTFVGKIFVNGQDRFIERNNGYFRLVQNNMCHTNIPRTKLYNISQNGNIDKLQFKNYNQFINTYSFALNPENFQPSGHYNFSHIKQTTLQLNYNSIIANYNVKIYAINYNILRIVNGIATLVF